MYDYQIERPKLFTPDGVDMILKIRDNAQKLLHTAGAFQAQAAWKNVTGDSWQMLAALDLLVERGEIRRVSPQGVWGQHVVYVEGNG